MEKKSRIFIAGATGLVGSAIVRKLHKEGYHNLLLPTHQELDLTNQEKTYLFFEKEQPEYVFDAAALVGGIKANSERPAEFFYENMQIENNLLWASHLYGVKKFLFLGSACMYPKDCEQPMKEEYLLTGIPEPTNEGYALAKISGSRLCSYLRRQFNDDFISAIPANTYGPGDSFQSEQSHVIPALITKYHAAKIGGKKAVELWGTGKARREFIHVDDLADATLFLMTHYSGELPINIGTGEEVSILELSKMIREIVGYEGEICCDVTKPDGMMRRIVDAGRLREMGWTSKIGLYDGLVEMYQTYLSEIG